MLSNMFIPPLANIILDYNPNYKIQYNEVIGELYELGDTLQDCKKYCGTYKCYWCGNGPTNIKYETGRIEHFNYKWIDKLDKRGIENKSIRKWDVKRERYKIHHKCKHKKETYLGIQECKKCLFGIEILNCSNRTLTRLRNEERKKINKYRDTQHKNGYVHYFGYLKGFMIHMPDGSKFQITPGNEKKMYNGNYLN